MATPAQLPPLPALTDKQRDLIGLALRHYARSCNALSCRNDTSPELAAECREEEKAVRDFVADMDGRAWWEEVRTGPLAPADLRLDKKG